MKTNGSGGVDTNTATIKMDAGHNFAVNYIYWYTNGGSLLPTNFTVAELPVLIRTNLGLVLTVPPARQGTNIDPALWFAQTNAITDPGGWPLWANLPDHYPFWPLTMLNADGAAIIVPSAQLPICDLQHDAGDNLTLTVQALPGRYLVQTCHDLTESWSVLMNLEVASDGTANMILALNATTNLFVRLAGPGPLDGLGFTVRFDTSGTQFAPAVYFSNGSPSQALWTWADATVSSTFPIASKDFGTDAARSQGLLVQPAAAITAINLGFDASDGGETTPLENRSSQKVRGVYFPYPLTSLRYWASSYNPITNTLDFTGFSSLEAIECFHCTNLQQVVASNLPALKRVCFENCDLQDLVLTGDPELEDVRAALNSYTNIVLGAGTGPKIWHFCTRDNPQFTQNLGGLMTNFYSLQEPWIWHDNQVGALSFVSSNLTDVEFQDNFYSYADLSGQPNLQILWGYDNLLTNIVLTGCSSLQDLQLQYNLLSSSALDNLLTVLDATATNLQTVDLIQNAEFPSAAGYAHYHNLTNRGVAVFLDFPSTDDPLVGFDSMTLVEEGCSPTNNAIDPGEAVTVLFAFKNSGMRDTTDLVVTLLSTNGILPATPSRDFGVLVAGGPPVTQPFAFTASGDCSERRVATFQLQDSGQEVGTISVPISLGVTTVVLSEDFDSALVPVLPAGWMSSASGAQFPWESTASSPDSGIHAAVALDVPDIGVSVLTSLPIALPLAPARLTFRNSYDLESADSPGIANDGGVLEIKIGANAFADIVAAGGTFVSGGYTSTITNIWGNPLADRQAWSGNSGGYVTTAIDLPAAAAGQSIQLRWRCGTDNGNSSSSLEGWRIDTVSIVTTQCCSGPP